MQPWSQTLLGQTVLSVPPFTPQRLCQCACQAFDPTAPSVAVQRNTTSIQTPLSCHATMLPQNACNLVAALSVTPQKDEVEWDLHMTAQWERRIPFCSYVSLETPTSSLQKLGSLFPRFSELPAELRTGILGFCTAPTLFQAMQASPLVRAEASKLFWTRPETYFPVPASWLLEGGYPGYAWWDSSFQDCVQNVEVEFHAGTDRSICPRPDGKVEIRQDRITTFWNTLRQRFPNAKKVLINLNQRIPSWGQDADPVPLSLRVLLYACPVPDIRAFAF